MIYQNFVACRSFSICYGVMGPNELMSSNYSTTGARNLAVYLYQGSANIVSYDQKVYECTQGNLTDLQSISSGMVTYQTKDSGAVWVCINNNQRLKEFNFELLNTATTKTIIGSDKETYLVCIEKTILCNNKNIVVNSYANIRQGFQAEIVIPENSIAILMIEK